MVDERLNDHDLQECAKYGNGFDFGDIEKSLACLFGENEGPSWHYVVKLKNGKYAYLTGWCDYTGWGCQEGGESKLASTALKAANCAPEDEQYGHKNVRKQLIAQIKGKQPYGLQV